MKQLERELIERAAKGDGAALTHVQQHLQEMTTAWGAKHAQIEAQQFVIYSIAVCNREQQEAFRMLLNEMIEQTPRKEKKPKLDELLEGINEDNLHGEIMSEVNVGKYYPKGYKEPGFRSELRVILNQKDWSSNDIFEAIDELHAKYIEKQG